MNSMNVNFAVKFISCRDTFFLHHFFFTKRQNLRSVRFPYHLECAELSKLPNCTLLYTLQTHDTLENVIQYVPENVVINGDDIIPGVSEDASEGLLTTEINDEIKSLLVSILFNLLVASQQNIVSHTFTL